MTKNDVQPVQQLHEGPQSIQSDRRLSLNFWSRHGLVPWRHHRMGSAGFHFPTCELRVYDSQPARMMCSGNSATCRPWCPCPSRKRARKDVLLLTRDALVPRKEVPQRELHKALAGPRRVPFRALSTPMLAHRLRRLRPMSLSSTGASRSWRIPQPTL